MAAKKPLHNTLRDKAEAKVKKLPLSALDLTMEKARVMMHELEVHQVELEMQNQELREAQHRLEEARDQYTDLFDFAPIGYLILDKKGVINNINLTACNLLGIERVHLKGKPLSAYMFSGEANKLLLKLRKAFKTGTLPALELHLKRNGNKDFTALIHGIVVVGGNQDNPLCRIAMQDVTELREAEALQQRHEDLQREKESIQQYNEELEAIVKKRTKELSEALEAEKQINEMKSAFITIASHELRTPITIIKSSVILIEKFKNLGRYDKIDPHVEHIKSSINNFTAILDDFLSLEKLERDAVRVKKENLEIPEFIKDLKTEMEGILKPGQHINYYHEGRTEIIQDKNILRHIIFNLLINAIKYSETDVTLRTQTLNGALTVMVKDKGIGIPLDDQKNLFKRFFRAKNVKDFQGTGLGLSIVERYLDLLNGTIQFKSIPGKGSTFTITLPQDS